MGRVMIRLVYRIITINILLISLVSCAMQVPKMEQSESSAIGISLEIEVPYGLGWLTRRTSEVVYFIRVDNNSNILQSTLIRSNYAKDGRVYLLNVLPGEYMAVAYSYDAQTGGPDVSNRYLVFFSKELIEKTYVRVTKRQVSFAGNYILSTSLMPLNTSRTEVDDAQRYYKNMMNPDLPSIFNPIERLKSLFDDDTNKGENRVPAHWDYLGSAVKSERNKNAKNKFLKKSKVDLAEGDWNTLIK